MIDLRQFRESRNLTQTELAKILGIRQQAIANAEATGKTPKDWIEKLTNHYDLPTNFFTQTINSKGKNNTNNQNLNDPEGDYKKTTFIEKQLEAKDTQIAAWISIANSQVEQMNKLIEILSSKLLTNQT